MNDSKNRRLYLIGGAGILTMLCLCILCVVTWSIFGNGAGLGGSEVVLTASAIGRGCSTISIDYRDDDGVTKSATAGTPNKDWSVRFVASKGQVVSVDVECTSFAPSMTGYIIKCAIYVDNELFVADDASDSPYATCRTSIP